MSFFFLLPIIIPIMQEQQEWNSLVLSLIYIILAFFELEIAPEKLKRFSKQQKMEFNSVFRLFLMMELLVFMGENHLLGML